jgi:hypothetical protein
MVGKNGGFHPWLAIIRLKKGGKGARRVSPAAESKTSGRDARAPLNREVSQENRSRRLAATWRGRPVRRLRYFGTYNPAIV